MDSAGRRIALPAKVERIMVAGPPAAVFLYAMAPETLVGWEPALAEAAKPFVAPSVRDLPESPRLTGKNVTIDVDRIKALHPDLILDFGSIAASYVSLAGKVRDVTGVPYALIDGGFDKLPESIRMVGEMLDRRPRADELAAYAERTLFVLDRARRKAQVKRPPRVYVARGADGLRTDVKGTGLIEIVERAGGLNAADDVADRAGVAIVTLQQLKSWKPDFILAYDRPAFEAMRKAMPDARTLLAPMWPWSWLGEPPSLNRLMGLRWLTALFYREVTRADIAAAARDFHRLFYGIVPSDAELAALVENAV